jgi:hypothetical protein
LKGEQDNMHVMRRLEHEVLITTLDDQLATSVTVAHRPLVFPGCYPVDRRMNFLGMPPHAEVVQSATLTTIVPKEMIVTQNFASCRRK